MKTYECYAKVVGSKYLGVVDAENREEALKIAQERASVSLCHQCECEDPEVDEIVVEEID